MAALATLASDILTALVAELVADGISVPARRYVHAGEVAWDCEQFVVSLKAMRPTMPGGAEVLPTGPGGCVVLRSAVFEVSLIRCAPVPFEDGTPPNLAALNTWGLGRNDDALSLMRGVARAHNAGSFGEVCSQVRIEEVNSLGPDGGFGGVAVTIAVQLT